MGWYETAAYNSGIKQIDNTATRIISEVSSLPQSKLKTDIERLLQENDNEKDEWAQSNIKLMLKLIVWNIHKCIAQNHTVDHELDLWALWLDLLKCGHKDAGYLSFPFYETGGENTDNYQNAPICILARIRWLQETEKTGLKERKSYAVTDKQKAGQPAAVKPAKGQNMARKRIGNEPQTGAEKQKLFRQRMKAKGYTERHIWLPKETPTPDLTGTAAAQPAPDADREAKRLQWETELRQEEKETRLKAARKAGRESERHKHHERGFVSGIIAAANCFVIGDRYSADIAMMLLHRLGIDRNRATAAGLGNYELSVLDKADAWIKPPKTHEA